MTKLEKTIEDFFLNYREILGKHDTAAVNKIRNRAFQSFQKGGFINELQKDWKTKKLKEFSGNYYHSHFASPAYFPGNQYFYECDIPDLKAYKITVYNGRTYTKDGHLTVLDNGIVYGSLSAAMKHYPAIVDRYFNASEKEHRDPVANVNTALFRDGVFIYIPGNIKETPVIQVSNRFEGKVPSLFHIRNLIVTGENTALKLIFCSDAGDANRYFTTLVNEVFLEENAKIDWFDYQNINNRSALIQRSGFQLSRQAELNVVSLGINGGLIRNFTQVDLNGKQGRATVNGLTLTDRDQHAGNQVFVAHNVPDCVSSQNFKSILDDRSKVFFRGHILVSRDAQRTKAFQNNANILLTDKAAVDTQPFLEIYADDVSCSHGATAGQLNEEALFYLRTRGIQAQDAKLLQLFAFTSAVLNEINIPSLKDRTEDIVKKRLRGEADYCDKCILQCKNPAPPADPFLV